MSRIRSGSIAVLLIALGCGTYIPANQPLERWDPGHGYRATLVDPIDDSEELVFLVALSGGGMRAAAFAYGVLQELAATQVRFDGQERALFDEIDSVSGVSGGSFAAAYLGLHDRAIFESFEDRVLRRNIQGALVLRLFWPLNWLKLLSPYWARSDLAADYYDAALFDHATFGDLATRGGPFVQIHATDLRTGSPFAFIQEQFDYLCSDLTSYRVSSAVAASSAIPLVLSPMTLRNFSDCGFEPPDWVTRAARGRDSLNRRFVNARNLLAYRSDDRRFVRLIDGVVSDNLAVRGPFEGWVQRGFQEKTRPPGAPVRNVVLLIVNAQTTPGDDWDRDAAGPSLSFILDAATSIQVNRYNFETIELLQRTFDQWDDVTSKWTPPLRFHLVETGFLHVPDEEERRELNRIPTSLRISDTAVERLQRAGRQALRGSPAYQSLLGALGATGR